MVMDTKAIIMENTNTMGTDINMKTMGTNITIQSSLITSISMEKVAKIAAQKTEKL
jgi:phosphopentomutase